MAVVSVAITAAAKDEIKVYVIAARKVERMV